MKIKIVKTPQPIKEEAPINPEPEKNLPKVVQVGGRNWLMAGGGGILVLVGFAGFAFYTTNQNMMIGGMAVMAIIGGGILGYYGLKPRESGIILTPGSKKAGKEKIIANSLNLYENRVTFEKLDDEIIDQWDVQPRKCRNDNKYYYVNIWNTAWRKAGEVARDAQKLIPFALPDTQYRDPREFANNLNIPAHRRLAQRKATLLEKVSPWIILVAIVISGIIWIATSPAPGAR